MFPEDFKDGQKEWPLSWWGIIEPSQEVLNMHPNLPKEYKKESSSKSKRNDRRVDGKDQRGDRRGNTGYDDKYEYGDQFHGSPSLGQPARSNQFDPPPQHFDRYDGSRGPPPNYHQPQHAHASSFSRGGSQNGHPPRVYGDDGRGFAPLPPNRTFGGRGFQTDRGFGHGPGRGGSHRHRG